MAITAAQAQELLEGDEPDYVEIAKLGIQLLPALAILIRGEPRMASRAVALAARMNDDRAVELMRAAAQHPSPRVRVAVATELRRVERPAAAAALMALLNDQDSLVRKGAIASAAIRPNPALLAKITELGQRDPTPAVRLLASAVINRTRQA